MTTENEQAWLDSARRYIVDGECDCDCFRCIGGHSPDAGCPCMEEADDG